MPINPFRGPSNYDVPNFGPPQGRYDPSVFSNIASIGEAIGARREQSSLAELAKSAVDPKTGQLNIEKYATAAALAGHDPVRALALVETARSRTTAENAQRALEAYHSATLTETARANAEREKIERERLNQPSTTVVPPSLMSPGSAITVPRDPTQPPVVRPFPQQSTPGPQSALEPPANEPPPPNMAAVQPGPGPGPENAPPYQVAGPPMPPPQAPATVAPPPVAAAPAVTPDRNEGYLRTLPPAAQTIVKGVANYDIDPATIQGKDREDVIAAAKTYRPNYSMSEYQKRGTPPSGEIAARIGLAKAFIEKVPTIRERLQNNELNSWQGAATAIWGQGGPGELRRAIDEGSESLLRGLTGAGMSSTEATNYARRYQFDFRDNKDTALRKLNELENALRYVTTEVLAGRGNENLIKGYQSQFGKEVVEKPTVPRARNEKEIDSLVGKARAAVKRDPTTYGEALRRLQERLPEGVDARMYLGQ